MVSAILDHPVYIDLVKLELMLQAKFQDQSTFGVGEIIFCGRHGDRIYKSSANHTLILKLDRTQGP